jgi:hypothetical protein
MNSSTSIGPGPQHGGNQDEGNADGRGNKTLGEHSMPEPEAGSEVAREPSQAADGKPEPAARPGPQRDAER